MVCIVQGTLVRWLDGHAHMGAHSVTPDKQFKVMHPPGPYTVRDVTPPLALQVRKGEAPRPLTRDKVQHALLRPEGLQHQRASFKHAISRTPFY